MGRGLSPRDAWAAQRSFCCRRVASKVRHRHCTRAAYSIHCCLPQGPLINAFSSLPSWILTPPPPCRARERALPILAVPSLGRHATLVRAGRRSAVTRRGWQRSQRRSYVATEALSTRARRESPLTPPPAWGPLSPTLSGPWPGHAAHGGLETSPPPIDLGNCLAQWAFDRAWLPGHRARWYEAAAKAGNRSAALALGALLLAQAERVDEGR